MATDDLNAPLRRQDKAKARVSLTPLVWGLAACAFIVASVAGVWIAAVDDPDGGWPVAVASIEDNEPATTGSLSGFAAMGPTRPQARQGSAALPDAAPGSMPGISGPDQMAALPRSIPPDKVRATAAPLDQLVEKTRFGPVPKIAEDGLRPMDAYARPAAVGPYDRVPRIVIILGGMGISQTGTSKAIRDLPEDVTLAFAPYGGSLGRWASRAREEGHEILLQVPMEPIGYPQKNPGEHTLLTSASGAANAQNLQWIMSRITSYTGVMNYMGARFLADQQATRSLLEELAGRGVFFLDDGSTGQSTAAAIGSAIRAPVVTADLTIDKQRSSQQIEKQLENLEQIARTKGVAVGVAAAFPTTVRTLAAWIPQARERGVVLVPASAALSR
ncbi:MAG: divergent polysaccharide deacetylase family protein [Hyphomicrobiales bacterium]|nr:divergent polysaccharide deacetylase family protein [Hyphomicrobiales bacterium]